jgi:hypothetical protein
MKRTSDRVSAIAARVLRKIGTVVSGEVSDDEFYLGFADRVTYGEVRALAASCLAQDEVKGKRPKKKRKAKP